jgi:hypothetical protein
LEKKTMTKEGRRVEGFWVFEVEECDLEAANKR